MEQSLLDIYRYVGKIDAYREAIDWWSYQLKVLPDNESRRRQCPELVQQFVHETLKRMTTAIAEAKTMEPADAIH